MSGLLGKLFGEKKKGEGASTHTHTLGQSGKPGQLRVLSGEELLSPAPRKAILNNIHSLISLPDKHFDVLIGQLLRNTAAYVQQLPATQRHHHASPGGLLDHSLEIALMGLLIRRGFMLPIGAPPEVLSKKQDIWSYATLSSALLKNVGVSLIQQQINTYDLHGKKTGIWCCIKESLAQHAFYDVAFITDAPTSLGARMTPLIAQMLMPKQGLLWLYEDRLIFNHWLAVLSWDVAGAGILGQMVDRANKENILKHTPSAIAQPQQTQAQQTKRLAEPPRALMAPEQSFEAEADNKAEEATLFGEAEKKPEASGEEDSFDDIRSRLAALLGNMEEGEDEKNSPNTRSQEDESLVSFDEPESSLFDETETKEGPETMQEQSTPSAIPSDVGEFFVMWLKEGLTSGRVTINVEKSQVHHVKEGLFLVFPGLFQLFCDDHPELEMQPPAIQKRFQRLKLHEKKREENICSYATYETGKRVLLRGYVIANPSTLIAADKLPPVNTKLELDYI